MSPLKQLATQTAIYGVSSIVGRFLNYLMVPLYTYHFAPAEYGVVSEFYAYAGFLAVVLTFGMETGYFRFRDNDHPERDITYATALWFLLVANLGFFALIVAFNQSIATMLEHPEHAEYVWWFALILVFDSVGAIAFARLRALNLAWQFAGVKLVEIIATVALNLFFIVLCRNAFLQDPQSSLGQLWDPAIGVGYVFIANLAASLLKLILLSPHLRGIVLGFDRVLFGRLIRYSLPMVVIGFAGTINEMLDRAILKYLLPYDAVTNLKHLGIYSACYKLSILISLFIQAFRYAAEPFFFAYAKRTDAPSTYATVMNFFVIFCVFVFLLVTLYLDVFKYFIGEAYREGLHIVPIQLLAHLFLGIYINLSIWYKLTDRTMMGAFVSLGGAVLTIALNIALIPAFGYTGAAWATLTCYGSMALASYLLGRKYYPVPYDVKRIVGYIGLGLLLFALHQSANVYIPLSSLATGTLLLVIFMVIAYALDIKKVLR